MKTIITKHKHVISSCFLAASLLMLPGCTGWFKNWFGSTTKTPSSSPSLTENAPQNTVDPNDPVLLYIDNEPMLTLNEFQKEVETLIASNPDLANIFELIPQAKENLLTGLVNQRIVDVYIKHNNIDQTAEYQQELASMVKSVQRLLNSNFLQKELNVSVTARDIKQFYDENKDKIPELKISAGGYKTQILKFESEDKAQQFLAKAKQLGFEKAASEDHLSASINNLRMVSAQTPGIDPQLKKEILNVTRAPSTFLYKADQDKGAMWVVFVETITAPEYQPFDKVEASLKQFLERKKQMEAAENKVEELKKQYHVVVNMQPIQKTPTQKENTTQKDGSTSPFPMEGMMDSLDQPEQSTEDQENEPLPLPTSPSVL